MRLQNVAKHTTITQTLYLTEFFIWKTSLVELYSDKTSCYGVDGQDSTYPPKHISERQTLKEMPCRRIIHQRLLFLGHWPHKIKTMANKYNILD